MTLAASACIAASRRHDRSITARLESARRASEIHQARTGRALRVTETHIINDEMYEEEDNGLHFPRLVAYLQAQNAAVEHKLVAYLDQDLLRAQKLHYSEASRGVTIQHPDWTSEH